MVRHDMMSERSRQDEREDEPDEYRVVLVKVPFSLGETQVELLARDFERQTMERSKKEAGSGLLEEDKPSGSKVHKQYPPLAVYRHNVEEQDDVDCCFFDEDYTIAAATGFTIWPGCAFMMDFLTRHMEAELPVLGSARDEPRDGLSTGGTKNTPHVQLRGQRVLELGSGIGMLGLYVASLGARVLMSDVPSVANDILKMNIERNSTSTMADAWRKSSSIADAATVCESPKCSGLVGGCAVCCPWPTSKRVGAALGSAAYMALDWTVPVAEQAEGFDPWDVDLLLATETVWLKELVQPYVSTVVELMKRKKALAGEEMRCLMCYTNRGEATSATFAVTSDLLDCFTASGCTYQVVHEGTSVQSDGEEKECLVFSISLQPSS